MTAWKKFVVGTVCVGAGLGLVLAAAFGGYLWYQSRPTPPKPWNKMAIKANFDDVDTEGEQNTLVFNYTLENTTPFDYRVLESSGLSIAARLKRENSLSMSAEREVLRIDYPIFIPPGQRLRFAVHLAYSYPGKSPPSDASRDARKEHREALKTYVNKEMRNLDGFVVFDESHRYQIELPRGW